MSIKKAKLDAVVQRTAQIIEEHLGTLAPAEAKAMLKDIPRFRKTCINSRSSPYLRMFRRSRKSRTAQSRFQLACLRRLADEKRFASR